MTEKPTQRRRILVIQPEQQKRLMRAATLPPALFFLGFGAVVGVQCWWLMTDIEQLDLDLPGLGALMFSVPAFAVGAAGLVLYQAIYFSNRIGGPAYRIINLLRGMRAGEEVRHLSLRDGDYLRDVAEEANQTLDWVRAMQAAPAATAAEPEAPAATPESVGAGTPE